MDNNPQPLLTVRQIAETLNVSHKTIYHWVFRREIPFTKVGRLLRFSADEVTAHFKQKTEENMSSCPSFTSLVESHHRLDL